MQAVDDALKRFPADEVVVVGRGSLDEELVVGLASLGVPVTWSGLTLRPATWHTRWRESMRSLGSGRSASTPWVAFVGANLGLLVIGVAIALVAMLIVWLAGDL